MNMHKSWVFNQLWKQNTISISYTNVLVRNLTQQIQLDNRFYFPQPLTASTNIKNQPYSTKSYYGLFFYTPFVRKMFQPESFSLKSCVDSFLDTTIFTSVAIYLPHPLNFHFLLLLSTFISRILFSNPTFSVDVCPCVWWYFVFKKKVFSRFKWVLKCGTVLSNCSENWQT